MNCSVCTADVSTCMHFMMHCMYGSVMGYNADAKHDRPGYSIKSRVAMARAARSWSRVNVAVLYLIVRCVLPKAVC